jgi:hypothetical protein
MNPENIRQQRRDPWLIIIYCGQESVLPAVRIANYSKWCRWSYRNLRKNTSCNFFSIIEAIDLSGIADSANRCRLQKQDVSGINLGLYAIR